MWADTLAISRINQSCHFDRWANFLSNDGFRCPDRRWYPLAHYFSDQKTTLAEVDQLIGLACLTQIVIPEVGCGSTEQKSDQHGNKRTSLISWLVLDVYQRSCDLRIIQTMSGSLYHQLGSTNKSEAADQYSSLDRELLQLWSLPRSADISSGCPPGDHENGCAALRAKYDTFRWLGDESILVPSKSSVPKFRRVQTKTRLLRMD